MYVFSPRAILTGLALMAALSFPALAADAPPAADCFVDGGFGLGGFVHRKAFLGNWFKGEV